MSNPEVARPYVEAFNAALKTAVKVAQRRFLVRFLDLHAHFLSQGRPEPHYFTFAHVSEKDDNLDKIFKLQDQLADPQGLRLSQQGVVTWRLKVADAFNTDPRSPTLPNP